jgi:hypothetical protein
MKHAIEMDPGAVLYIPSSIKTGSGIPNLKEGDTQTIAWCWHKPTFKGKYATN